LSLHLNFLIPIPIDLIKCNDKDISLHLLLIIGIGIIKSKINAIDKRLLLEKKNLTSGIALAFPFSRR